jgi:hypothetical protein
MSLLAIYIFVGVRLIQRAAYIQIPNATYIDCVTLSDYAATRGFPVSTSSVHK